MMAAMSIHLHEEMSLRDKARLNVDIARDLAESFGGNIAEYLKRLNGNLKKQVAMDVAKQEKRQTTAR